MRVGFVAILLASAALLASATPFPSRTNQPISAHAALQYHQDREAHHIERVDAHLNRVITNSPARTRAEYITIWQKPITMPLESDTMGHRRTFTRPEFSVGT
ncbi:hypothetical protein PIIN_10242 [Serendipita indica DSM 11827]|uniref:Uncharacterized protein n=1 Tax=Serendipita indica (strain DSM 11827) TaxID=1109443 RepID=G4TY57_SERID|nr:hypothetical protein PIIN_10242 [Serendipita indica DSM 11827]